MNFWALSSPEVLNKLDSSFQGLTHSQSLSRLKANGPNLVEKDSARSALKIFLLQFKNWLITILLFSIPSKKILISKIIDWRGIYNIIKLIALCFFIYIIKNG